jgi:hypothetical protein
MPEMIFHSWVGGSKRKGGNIHLIIWMSNFGDDILSLFAKENIART